MSSFDLTGKIALVTGASRGLGQTFALALARAGADVAITSRTLAALDKTRQAVEALGRRCHGVVLDVRVRESIEEAVFLAHAHFGRIDILVNNAACHIRKPALEVTWDDWNTVLETNLRGPFFVAQAVARQMAGTGSGRIINVGAVTSAAGCAGVGPCDASRGGIRQLTMSLAEDWGPHGITVNCLAPGWFNPAETAAADENPGGMASWLERIPFRRPGRPDDLEGAVVFLASDAGAYITGQTLFVDGGISASALRAVPAKKA